MHFEQLSKEKASKREHAISEYWNSINLLKRSVETRKDAEHFIFYEGPPTANGKPGIHHVIARTLKDLTCRYKTMKGYRVERKGGWDTHGLPVEIEVEKELGLHNKQDIEDYGVEAFIKKCRESVFRYEKSWRDMTEKIAFLIDMDDPYITMEDRYIESVWHILDTMNKDGAIYESHKILPYCSRCGTGLASHEVAQGYKEIKSETVIAKFKKKDEDAYFLAWTTTPWTLPSNVALTVHPKEEIVKVRQNAEVYYLAAALADKVLGEDYEVIERMAGKELEHMQYEPLMDFMNVEGNAYFVTLADYVTAEDGTGIVHTAPAFGEDDYQNGVKYDLAFVQPVNTEGKFTETPWKDMFVMDADPLIVDWLRQEGKLYSKQRMEHNYPHCWRCDTPLLYYAAPSWYIEITRVKEQMIAENQKVNWYPPFMGEKRFGNWLENLNDWAISRSRYWGTPFPMWRCNDCGKTESIGSKQELVDRAIEDIDLSIELHRPYVDEVHIKCPHCGGVMTREEDVIDVWFDSGAMPFAQRHYPFEHKDDFEEKYFPADFICEGVDQTRGWFYSLMAISTYMTGRSPYKSVLVNDLVLDKEGKKMSKSRGNTLDPFALIEEYGADVIRFYSLYVSNPWVPTRFDVDGLREVESKFFRSFRNVYNFFSLYANTETEDAFTEEIPYADRPEIDRWILSRYHHLIGMYHEEMDRFELTKVVRAINDFVIEDLSNWYIRRNRRRFWKDGMDDDKKAVYQTTREILSGIAQLVAPFTPFIAEEIYRHLTDGESVHLTILPEPQEAALEDALEEKMDLVRLIVTLGRASREEAKIKVRQPLQEIVVDGKYEAMLSDLSDLIQEELNVKNVRFSQDLTAYMNYSLKPDFRASGSVLGKKIRSFQKALSEGNAREFLDEMEEKGSVTMELDGEKTVILPEYVETKVSAKEGFNVAMENKVSLLLDTTLTDELLAEGYAREFVSKVQQMRKNNDYEVQDTIVTAFAAEDDVAEALLAHEDFIRKETLTTELVRKETLEEEATPLNDKEIRIALTRNE
ncbi:MAG: isoleucine--tRNA ligase [Peptoniphilaceae bacterium]|jgi:isoleucyl-tRNA synthetase